MVPILERSLQRHAIELAAERLYVSASGGLRSGLAQFHISSYNDLSSSCHLGR